MTYTSPDNPSFTLQYEQALNGGNFLPVFLRSCLDRSLIQSLNANNSSVPVTNALKNILGDCRKNPSSRILKYLYDLHNNVGTKQKTDSTLTAVGKEGILKAVFVMDLEDAVQSNDWDKAEEVAASLFLAAENKLSIVDILTELGLQAPQIHATRFYHLGRSLVFYKETHLKWDGVKLGINWLKDAPVSDPHPSTKITPEELMPGVLTMDKETTLAFISCWRLWNSESIRAGGFRREISYCLSEISSNVPSTGIKPEDNKTIQKPDFVATTEQLITRIPEQELPEDLVLLEGLRYCWENVDSTGKSVILARIEDMKNGYW